VQAQGWEAELESELGEKVDSVLTGEKTGACGLVVDSEELELEGFEDGDSMVSVRSRKSSRQD